MDIDAIGTVVSIIILVIVVSLSVGHGTARERYQRPNVTCARVNQGVGELEVDSSHSEHLIREMNLPPNAKIHIMERNHSYLVRFKLPGIHSGRQAICGYVQDWARANGYQGPVEER